MPPALTHVNMWTGHGWKRITANEAARIFPSGTVSAHTKLFMCELCGQYVTLTDGYEKTRYFKHSAYEKSKNCPDRTFATGTSVSTYNPRKYDLPIKLSLQSADDFSLAIGFLFVPRDILEKQTSHVIRVYPQKSDQAFTYLFERLSESGITYLSVGENPAKSYKIECDDALHAFWPENVSGIDPEGSVFSKDSGIKLPYNSDAKVGEKYYLLRQRAVYGYHTHVKVNQLCQKRIGWSTWYVYEIEATAYEEDAARFFLDLHCQLRDEPLKFQMLWPVYKEEPCFIKQNGSKVFLRIKGKHEGISLKSYPPQKYSILANKNESCVTQINCDNRQTLFTAGRTGVMEYLYFWREPLTDVTDCPIVNVTDIHNVPIEEGVIEKLPEKSMLVINAPYDGTVTIYRRGKIKGRFTLISKHTLNVKIPGYEAEIRITQGLDIVWSANFRKKKEQTKGDDEELLKELKSFSGSIVQTSHNLGAIAEALKPYPKTRNWVYTRIRTGEISYKALQYLEHFLYGSR